MPQGQRDRGRDRADAHLDGGAIRDELGHVLADAPLDIADRGKDVLVRWLVDVHREVDLVDVDERVAERARHRAC